MATNSLAFQMYALEHGLEDLVDSDKSNVTEKKNEVPKSFDWTAVESDSSSDEDDDEQSPLAVKVKKPIARDDDDDDDDDESSSDDEDVTRINVNWLDDSDEEVEEDDDDEDEAARTKTSVSVQSNKKSNAKIADLVPFFRSPKQHIRIAVATQVAGLSSTVEGRNLINSPLIMQHLCRLLGGDDKEAKPALQALINMCQLRMFKLNLAKTGIVKRLINSVMDKSQRNLRNLQCMLLSNVTQDARGSRELLDLDGESKGRPVDHSDRSLITQENHWKINARMKHSIMTKTRTPTRSNTGTTLRTLVNILLSGFPTNQKHDLSTSCKSDCPQYLAHLLINVTQLQEGRDVMLEKKSGILVSLLPFFESRNEILRQGIVGMLKNLCHELKFVSWLLSSDVDALGRTMRLLESVVVSTSQGKQILRKETSVKTLCKIESDLNESSVPISSKEKLSQVILIAQGKSDQIVLKRNVKPGDVIPV